MCTRRTDVYGALDDMAVGIRLVLLMSIRQLLPAGGVGSVSRSYRRRGELPVSAADGFEHAFNPAYVAPGKRAGLPACFGADNYDGRIDRSISRSRNS